MTRLAGCLFAIVGALVLAASAQAVLLVTPQGHPVGGKWQRWADGAKVPTIAGRLVFYPDASLCGGAAACSEGAPWLASAPVWTAVAIVPTSAWITRWDLYFELGHQFDWQELTWPERAWLARHWTIETPIKQLGSGGQVVRRWPWENSRTARRLNGEDGLGWAFATLYADCAMGRDDKGASITPMGEPRGVWGPSAIPRIDTCQYL